MKRIYILSIILAVIISGCNTLNNEKNNVNLKEKIEGEWEIENIESDKFDKKEGKNMIGRTYFFTNNKNIIGFFSSKDEIETISITPLLGAQKYRWEDNDTISEKAFISENGGLSEEMKVEYDLDIKGDKLYLNRLNPYNVKFTFRRISEGIKSDKIRITDDIKESIEGKWLIISKEKDEKQLVKMEEKIINKWTNGVNLGSYIDYLGDEFKLYNEVIFTKEGLKIAKQSKVNKYVDENTIYISFENPSINTEFKLEVEDNILVLDNGYGFKVSLVKVK